MKKFKALTLIAAQTLALAPCASVWAVTYKDDALGTAATYQRLDDFEEVLYGEPRKYLTVDARLKELEVKILGAAQSGSYDQRLAAVSRKISEGVHLNPGETSDMTPELDSVASGKNRVGGGGSSASGKLPNYDVDSSAALEEAMHLYSDGRIAEAEAAFHGIIARDPKSADAFYNLAVIQESRGDNAGALSNYKQAYTLKPQESDYASAVKSMENKLAASFGGSAASGSQSVAAPAPVASAPPSSDVDFNRIGQGKSAVSAADKKLVSEASAKFKAGQYDQAIDKLRLVAGRNPRDADVQYAIAQAYRGKGDTVGARSYMARAVELAPQNATFKQALASLSTAAASTAAAPAYTPPVIGDTGSTPATGGIQPFANAQAPASGEIFQGKATASGDKNRRIKRAITYGIAGAATSVLASTLLTPKTARGGKYNVTRMRNAALTGAALGGMMGYVLGK